MISLDEALERILAEAAPLTAMSLPLVEASGHILARPVIARCTQPPFDASAMDGYAVRAADVGPGAILPQGGLAEAGSSPLSNLAIGGCMRIFTGAPVPQGADAVVMQEQTELTQTGVRFMALAEAGQNIRRRGKDFTEGETLLAAGTLLSPAAVMLAAAGNHDRLDVISRPRLALLATGNELAAPGSVLAPGQIVGSNSAGLAALFAPHCLAVTDHGTAPDDAGVLAQRLGAALHSDADVIVTTGGASVGDLDLVQPALKSLGVDIDFWKIAIRPGKPLMFGTLGRKLVFGLPGNPVSAMVTALVVVLPALRRLAGWPDPRPATLRIPTTTDLPQNGPRRHFMRAQLAMDAGRPMVRSLAETDSAHISSLAGADALIVRGENAAPVRTGEWVECLPLPWADFPLRSGR